MSPLIMKTRRKPKTKAKPSVIRQKYLAFYPCQSQNELCQPDIQFLNMSKYRNKYLSRPVRNT